MLRHRIRETRSQFVLALSLSLSHTRPHCVLSLTSFPWPSLATAPYCYNGVEASHIGDLWYDSFWLCISGSNGPNRNTYLCAVKHAAQAHRPKQRICFIRIVDTTSVYGFFCSFRLPPPLLLLHLALSLSLFHKYCIRVPYCRCALYTHFLCCTLWCTKKG